MQQCIAGQMGSNQLEVGSSAPFTWRPSFSSMSIIMWLVLENKAATAASVVSLAAA